MIGFPTFFLGASLFYLTQFQKTNSPNYIHSSLLNFKIFPNSLLFRKAPPPLEPESFSQAPPPQTLKSPTKNSSKTRDRLTTFTSNCEGESLDEPLFCQTHSSQDLYCISNFGLSFKVEGLYWTSREHHLVNGITLAGLNPTDQMPPALDHWNFRGKLRRIEPGWNLGLRACIGYTIPCYLWDVFLDWTSFHSSKSSNFDLLELPAWNPWGYPDIPEAVKLYDLKSHWSLEYDTFSLEFGRAFCISKNLNLRPHFGITGSFINQNFQHVFDYEPFEFIPFGSTLDLGCNFSGAGLCSGFNMQFTCRSGLGFYGKACYQLRFGSFDTSLNQTEFFAAEVGDLKTKKLPIANSHDKFIQGISSFCGILGINWDKYFYDNRYRLGLNVQWELNQINDFNRFHHYSHFLFEGIHRQENTNLGLMGISFGGNFDF